jgi:hypothetical protein
MGHGEAEEGNNLTSAERLLGFRAKATGVGIPNAARGCTCPLTEHIRRVQVVTVRADG